MELLFLQIKTWLCITDHHSYCSTSPNPPPPRAAGLCDVFAFLLQQLCQEWPVIDAWMRPESLSQTGGGWRCWVSPPSETRHTCSARLSLSLSSHDPSPPPGQAVWDTHQPEKNVSQKEWYAVVMPVLHLLFNDKPAKIFISTIPLMMGAKVTHYGWFSR